jgi:hypothetical protein
MRHNIIIKVTFLFFFLLLSFSCNKEINEEGVSNIEKYLTPFFTIDLNDDILEGACLECLTIIGDYKINEINYLAFLDYLKSTIYLYNNSKDKFESKFEIPKTCEIADVLWMFNYDSLVYFNNDKNTLVVSDQIRIKNEYKPLNFPYDSSFITFTSFDNKLKTYENNFIFNFGISLDDTNIDQYHSVSNTINLLGLFKLTENGLYHTPINIKTQIKESDKQSVVNNTIVFAPIEKEKKIVFSHVCSDSIYIYSFVDNRVSKMKPQKSKFNISPQYFKSNNRNPQDYFDALNEQNMCLRLLYSKKNNLIYRQLLILGKDSNENYLQVFDLKLNLIKEVYVPSKCYIEEFDGYLIVKRLNANNKQLVYEKLDINIY